MVMLAGRLFLMSEVPLYPCTCSRFTRPAGFTRARSAEVLRFPCEEVPFFMIPCDGVLLYMGTSLIRNSLTLGPYSRPMPKALWWSSGGWRFLMNEVPLRRGWHAEEVCCWRLRQIE